MNSWAPLWSMIASSSLWEESGDVVKVFITMLAKKDYDHVCRMDAYAIAKSCYLDELRVLDILKILASPDTRRKIPQPYDGRRIKAVDGGWFVLNGEKYRNMVQDEMRRARNRKAQATYRANHPKKPTPLPGEVAAVKAMGDGDDDKADAINVATLPAQCREEPTEYITSQPQQDNSTTL